MEKTVTLKDGSKAVIRTLEEEDADKSFSFFQNLPEQDRVFLRVDVSKPDLVKKRIRDIGTGRVRRLAAVVNDEIVADGSLELEGYHEWRSHVGELRLFVAKEYQRKGLGTLMARELCSLAGEEKVEEIIVKMMRPQVAARSIFTKLGFHDEVSVPGFVKDRKGRKQDLVMLRCDLQRLWKEFEDELTDSDWRRLR